MGRMIWEINDPAERLKLVKALARAAYPDPEDYDGFVEERHRGVMAMKMGAPDMDTFVEPMKLVENGDAFDCRRVVEYLENKIGMEPN